MSDHYTRSGTFSKASLARGDTVQTEFDSVETGFDGLEAEVDLCLRFTADDFAASPLTISTTAANRQSKVLGCNAAGTAFEFKSASDLSSIATTASDEGKLVVVDANGDLVVGTVLNDGSADLDFRIESDGDANAFFFEGSTGNIGLGTATPNAEALLDLTSTTKALMLTRMTTTQRDAMTGAAGLLIYNTSTNKLNVYTGAGWEAVTSS